MGEKNRQKMGDITKGRGQRGGETSTALFTEVGGNSQPIKLREERGKVPMSKARPAIKGDDLYWESTYTEENRQRSG